MKQKLRLTKGEVVDYFTLQGNQLYCICDICGKGFSSLFIEELKQHLKKKHFKIIKNDRCDYATNSI